MSGVFDFQVTERDGDARSGRLSTPHGVIHTPAFMPVATRGTVKAMTHRDLLGMKAEVILAYTYDPVLTSLNSWAACTDS